MNSRTDRYMKKNISRTFLGLCDPTIFMACDCTAFTAREIGFPRSVGFLRGGMVAFFKTVVNTPEREERAKAQFREEKCRIRFSVFAKP